MRYCRPVAATRIVQPPRGCVQDTQQAGDARVRLKLVAMAYADARRGNDDDLVRAALVALHEVALLYREALSGGRPATRRPTSVDHAALCHLQVLAIAYACARHGADSCSELCRDALAMLCSGAAWYADAIEGSDRGRERASAGSVGPGRDD